MSTRNVIISLINIVFTDFVHVPALQHGLQHQQSYLINGMTGEAGSSYFAERRKNLWRKLDF